MRRGLKTIILRVLNQTGLALERRHPLKRTSLEEHGNILKIALYPDLEGDLGLEVYIEFVKLYNKQYFLLLFFHLLFTCIETESAILVVLCKNKNYYSSCSVMCITKFVEDGLHAKMSLSAI